MKIVETDKLREYQKIYCGSIALLFSFTCIFYICISSYLSGINDFWFSLKDFIIPLLVVSVIIFILVYLLCLWIPRFFAPIFFGVSFCAYLQINFLNADYGLIDGHTIDWSSYGNYGFFNLICWIGLTILFVFLFNCFLRTQKAIIFISLLLCTMQFAGMIGEVILSPGKEDKVVVTKDSINTIGDGNNLIMIVLDTFDVRHAQYLLDTQHAICKQLEGFTFYKNAVSPYPKTKTSIPYMLTANIYRNEQEYDSFLTEAYQQSELINQLYENHYNIGIYTEITDSFEAFENKVINIKNAKNAAPQPSSTWKLWMQLMRYSLFRELPHTLKKEFTVTINDFNRIAASKDKNTAYIMDDPLYYTQLKSDGLSVQENTNAFRLIHLNGMHEPITLNSEAQEIKESTVYEQLDGIMVILAEYLESLHNAGVYDQTAIMVLGDHGAILGNQPALLYKPMNSKGALKVSNSAIYYEDIHKTLLNEIGLTANYGENITTFTETTRERMYYDYRIDDPAPEQFFPDMWEAIYTNDNVSPSYTGYIYTAGETKTYSEYAKLLELNTVISGNTMRNYFNSNFLSWGENDYIWGKGLESVLLFKLKNIPEHGVSVKLNFIEWIDSPSKPLTITTMDNTVLYEHTYYQGDENPVFEFQIPPELFDTNGAVALRMLWGNDSSALTSNNSDLRQKQVGLKSILIQEVN